MCIIGLILLTTIGSMIVSVIFYAIGYYGGYGLICKLYAKYKKIDRYKMLFDKYNKRAIFIARCIPFSRTYVSLFAGVCRQNFYSYLFFSFFGIFMWNALLVSLGFSLYMGIFEWEIFTYFKLSKILI